MTKYFRKYSNTIILILILFIAFFSRLYFFSQEGFITTDGVQYLLSGKNLIETGRYEIFGNPQLIFPPGYSLAVGVADHFFNNLVFSARLVSFIAGFLAVYFFYLVGKELYNKETGLLASFFAATLQFFILISNETWSESLHILFVLITIYLYLKIIKNYRHSLAMLLGLSIGITYLIRPEGIIFLALAVIFLFQKPDSLKFKKAIAGSSLIILTFSIAAAPYICFLYQNTGKLCLTAKAEPNLITGEILNGKDMGDMDKNDINLYEKTFSNYDEKTNSIKLPEEFANVGLKEYIFNNPADFSDRYAKGILSEIKILINEYLFNIFLIPIIALFIFALMAKKLFKEIFLLSFFPIIFLLMFPIFHIESRYLLQVMIFVILLASLGLSIKCKAALNIKSFKFSGALFLKILKLLTIVLISLNFIAVCIQSLYIAPDYPIEHKTAGEYIKNSPNYNSEKSVIMSRKPFAAFYAGSKNGNVPIPYTSAENILKFAKARNVSYIVIDERWLEIRDNYEELKNLDKRADQLKLVYEDNSTLPIKVFEVSY